MTVPVEIESRRRLLLGSLMPFVLLLAALIAVPRLLPGGVYETYRTMLREKIGGRADGPYGGAPCGSETEVEGCHFKAATLEPVYAASYRRSALAVVDRWERERRHRGGRANISPRDLMRLRRALL